MPPVQQIELDGANVALASRRQIVRRLARLRQGVQAPAVPVPNETEDRTDVVCTMFTYFFRQKGNTYRLG